MPAMLLAVAGFGGNHSALNATGPQAGHIEHTFMLFFWVTAIVYTLVILVMFVSVAKRRSRLPNIPAPMQTTEASDRSAMRMVAGSMAVTITLLFVLLVSSFFTSRATASLTSQTPVTVNVYGHQWWWELNYPNGEADKTVDTANEIHIPVGVPVMIHSTSRDVIHSFWAPNIHGKRDLLPGYQTDLFIQVDQPGIWRGQCVEFCGEQHAHMSFLMVAQSKKDYDAWLAAQAMSAPDPQDPMAARGKQVFLTHSCVMCHTIRGTTANARTGPDLTHLASRQTIAAGTLSNNIGNLAGWILNPQSIKPGVRMPPNPMPSEDLNALLAYLETLR